MIIKKIKVGLIIILFYFFTSPLSAAYIKPISKLDQKYFETPKENRLFFFTIPRSGTHWVFYILSYFTERPISTETYFYDLFDLPYDLNKPYIHHYHNPEIINELVQFSPPNIYKDKLLIVLRNPIEKLLRGRSVQEAKQYYPSYKIFLRQTIDAYLRWPQSSRCLIYFEDLIKNPRSEIEKLLTFLNEPLDQVEEFIENINIHKSKSYELYNIKHQAKSDGNDPTFYSKKCTQNEIFQLYTLLKNDFSDVWDEFFKNYDLIFDESITDVAHPSGVSPF